MAHTSEAIEVLRRLHSVTGTGRYVFPSLRSSARPISNNTVNAALRRLGYPKDEMCGHGFRALASTRLNEQGVAPDLIALQLAHAERNKVRAAYNRATRLAERRAMRQTWADYLDGLKRIGREWTQRLYDDPLVIALKNELRRGRDSILKALRLRRGKLVNAMGLIYKPKLAKNGKPKDTPAMRLAHILQGIEAQMLNAVVRRFPDDILVLEHDGWTARCAMDKAAIKQLIRRETGFVMRV